MNAGKLAEVDAGMPDADFRRAALSAFLSGGVPGPREEQWRYAPLRELEQASFRTLPRPAKSVVERVLHGLPEVLPGHARLVLIDGHAVDAAAPAIAGLQFLSPADAGLELSKLEGDLRFGALNAAHAPLAIRLQVAPGASLGIEILCIGVSASNEGAAHPLVSLEVMKGARLRLIERHLSGEGAAPLSNALIEARLHRDASFLHTRLQATSKAAVHLETLRVELDGGAQYEVDSFAVGAAGARTTAHIRMNGPGARVRYAHSLAIEGTQIGDTYAFVEHASPDTQTIEDYRGIVGDRARAGFIGRIRMHAGAARSNSRQTLRNLVTGPSAEANARPQLEIHTDDVKASHGATVGKLDEDMLFYLLSRGIDRATAEALLKRAFLGELIRHVPEASLRREIEQHLLRGSLP